MKTRTICTEERYVELQDFKEFLEEVEAFFKWARAASQDLKFDHIITSIEGIFSNPKFQDGMTWNHLVDGAFVWGNTHEGIDYWSLVDKLWKKRLDELNVVNYDWQISTPVPEN